MEEDKNTAENSNIKSVEEKLNSEEIGSEKKIHSELEYNYVSVENDDEEIKLEDESEEADEVKIRREEENLNIRRDGRQEDSKFDEDQDFNFRPDMVETTEKKEGDKMSTTYILLAVFIILLGISYTIKNKSFNKGKIGQDTKIITNVAEEKINKVEIKKGENITVIEKNGNEWKVASRNGFFADKEAVGTLIKKSLELNKYIIASENKEKQSEFEVGEGGINVILYEGDNKVADFFVGKAGPDFDSTYVRITGEDVVYLSRGYVGYYFDKEDWRDLIIYDFEVEKVNKLALKYRDVANNVVMHKDGEKWNIEGQKVKEANKDKVDSILNILSKLKAYNIESAKTPKEAGFAAASLVVRLELEDGGKRNLIIGGELENDKNNYYVKKEEDNTIYIINKTTVDTLMKKKSDF